jgi:hypothetical protein
LASSQIDLEKLPGRPKGSIADTTSAVQCAAHLVRIGKQVWCRKNGTKIATRKTPVDRLVKLAIELVELDAPSVRGKIDPDAVRDFQLKPSRAVMQYVSEDMGGAINEIRKEALRKV